MTKVTLVNVKQYGRAGVKMIGRSTKYGNPYKLTDYSRDESVAKFRELWYSDEYAEIRQQAREELRGETLGCYCKPQKCHGDVIVEFLRECDGGS